MGGPILLVVDEERAVREWLRPSAKARSRVAVQIVHEYPERRRLDARGAMTCSVMLAGS